MKGTLPPRNCLNSSFISRNSNEAVKRPPIMAVSYNTVGAFFHFSRITSRGFLERTNHNHSDFVVETPSCACVHKLGYGLFQEDLIIRSSDPVPPPHAALVNVHGGDLTSSSGNSLPSKRSHSAVVQDPINPKPPARHSLQSLMPVDCCQSEHSRERSARVNSREHFEVMVPFLRISG
jgi:hypothetical protein